MNIFATGMYELVVIYENGDKDVYSYKTEEQAEAAGRGMKMALGDQLAWYCTRPQMRKEYDTVLLKDLLGVLPANEVVYLRSTDGKPCTREIHCVDQEKYGKRRVKEISTSTDEFFGVPFMTVTIEGEID